MTRKRSAWTVRLSDAAETDLQDIMQWTLARFGAAQARTYAKTLSIALEALADGPTIIGAKVRDDIAKGLFTLHVARQHRKGRHFVLYRIGTCEGKDLIEVLRILHDAMDLPRHLPSSEGDS